MKILIEKETSQLTQLNEMKVNITNSLPNDIEQSIYYSKLKQLLHPEIYNFCKEKTELKQDLNILRMNVGLPMSETEIREYLDTLKSKYSQEEDIGLEYHIEATRYDYGVPVFVVIKRNDISVKKLVFRFRKTNQATGIGDVSNSGIPLDVLKEAK